MGKVKVKEVTGGRGFLTESEYNREMEEWSRQTQSLAKSQAAMLTLGKKRNHTYKKGKKAGQTEKKLRNSIQFQLKSRDGEVAGVAFQFPIHGIFKEYGVARRYPASGYLRRSLSDWLSASLDRQDDKLADIVAEYQSDKVLHTFRSIAGKASSLNVS